MIVLRIGKSKIRLGFNKKHKKVPTKKKRSHGFTDMLKFSTKIVSLLTVFCLITGFIIRIIPTSRITPKVIANAKKQKGVICLNPVGGEKGKKEEGKAGRADKDNLEICLAVKKELEKKNYKVILTRDDDSNVKISDRIAKANKKNCDLMISIDRNKSKDDKPYGINAFISNSKNLKSQYLAASIINEMNGLNNYDFNGKMNLGKIDNAEDNYLENSKSNMPSCMLFIGSVSSKDDNKYFDEQKDQYAKAIANGIDSAYYNIFLSGDKLSNKDVQQLSNNDFSDNEKTEKIDNEDADKEATEIDEEKTGGDDSQASDAVKSDNKSDKYDEDEDSYGDLSG